MASAEQHDSAAAEPPRQAASASAASASGEPGAEVAADTESEGQAGPSVEDLVRLIVPVNPIGEVVSLDAKPPTVRALVRAALPSVARRRASPAKQSR
jgi:hypothetical protein